MTHVQRMRGVVLGTSVGDSLGLPAEGIGPQRIARMFQGGLRQRFILGKGMVSDDTDHTVFVCLSLLASGGSARAFSASLAGYLRRWLLCLPAGIGMATLKSIIRLWLGFDPSRSGVYSAGNGPAMRVAPIGAFFAHDAAGMEEFVRASTLMTHTDPKAFVASMAVAALTARVVAGGMSEPPPVAEFADLLLESGRDDGQWAEIVATLAASLSAGHCTAEFAAVMGQHNGVSGYIYRTVPVALYAWHRHFGDFRGTMEAVFHCGGDTDTSCAIAGAMAGAVTGEDGIPEDWVRDIADYPHGVDFLRQVADALADARGDGLGLRKDSHPGGPYWSAMLVRNAFFLAVVLAHGIRRLLPPY